jgi:hypothetical protein
LNLDVIDNEVDGHFVFAASGHDDVGVCHGRSDEDVKGGFHVAIVLLKNALQKKSNLDIKETKDNY